MTAPTTAPTTALAFARYRALEHRLPAFRGTKTPPRRIADLRGAFEDVDAFILDAFGVLNRGTRVVPGAVARIAQMRAAGKRVLVLTNGALLTPAQTVAKFAAWGYDFSVSEIISSRQIAADDLAQVDGLVAAITPASDSLADLPPNLRPLTPDTLRQARAFVFLDAQGWDGPRQQALHDALARNPRPVLCANPDIIAPRDTGNSWEPGHFCHLLPPEVPVRFFGKPFAPAFDAALARLRLPAERVAMVGDTLHTDILGGAAAGCQTVLITDHGFMAGHDPAPFMQACGITPGFIAPTT